MTAASMAPSCGPEPQRTHLHARRLEYLAYFNRAALGTPAVTASFGTLGRNVVYGFALQQVNLVLTKSVKVRVINEGARLTFRSEFYNLLNHKNFAAPDVNIANATFGRVSSTFDPRFVQMALKLSF